MASHIILIAMETPPLSTDAPAPSLAQSDDAAIFAELARLNTPDRNWGKPLLVFAVTLLLFSVTGWVRYSDPFFLGLLVGVLFFHEAGHFVAMRLFGYRNVRLFFIPFFGAAVSGRTFHAAGWKKALVSLMGPLPGIVSGTVLISAMLWAQCPNWVLQLGILLIFLNLFNLLPLQPLDGGRFLNALIFCRNDWLEAAFRALTGALLGLVACKLQSFLLGLVAFFVVFSTAATYKAAVIASRLRDQLPKPDPAIDEIPTEAAVAIIRAIQAEMPRLKTSKQIAGLVQSIYEAATARRPSFWPSVGLLLLYPILFLLPIAPLVAFVVFDPGSARAWCAGVEATRAARLSGVAEKREVCADIPPIERRFPTLGSLKSVRWVAEKTTPTSRFSALEHPVYRWRGYARLGPEKIDEFSNYPWKKAGPEFQPAFSILGDPAPQARWSWCEPFTKNCKPAGATGELYFDPRNGLVYFDIEGE